MKFPGPGPLPGLLHSDPDFQVGHDPPRPRCTTNEILFCDSSPVHQSQLTIVESGKTSPCFAGFKSQITHLELKNHNPKFNADETAALANYKSKLDKATKFIPGWVKVAVALALGFGTMVGWKRIVVTVGEKIGKEHLTYAQGACAELVAMATISAADNFGLPVSTTHVLSSGVAGTMAANRSGLQFATLRNIAMAWVLTLPAAALLSGSLFWLFRHLT